MSSNQEHNSTKLLKLMIDDINHYKRDRSVILRDAINKRLNESLAIYYKSVQDAEEVLENRSNLNVIRKLNKYDK